MELLTHTLILLAVAVAVVVLFRHLHLPPIFGYLSVGVLVGPHGAAWIPQSEETGRLAEFGVVFLLFTIGLEFSLPRLLQMRSSIALGAAQVVLMAAITALIGTALGMSAEGAIAVGGVVAMSSTAIVSKQLTDQLELHEPHGRHAIGVLLVQDLAVVPLLVLVASFTSGGASPLFTLAWGLAKGLLALGLILALGRWVLRPLFHSVARTRSTELFTLSALLITLASAWVTDRMGLSLALGAFLAGMMLGETEFRHQLEVTIRPFRDVLLALFFITIGMLLDVRSVLAFWNWVALLLCALVVFKTLGIALLARVFGADRATALRTGLVLAQGGEFGFAILSLAMGGALMPPDYGQVVLAALFFSMALSPLLIRFNGVMASAIFSESVRGNERNMTETVAASAGDLEEHVILCGYGRVGQSLARLLEAEGFKLVALDVDPVRVQNARLAGEPVSFGDATHHGILEAAGLARAAALVICIDDKAAALKILDEVRSENRAIPVLVRTRDPAEIESLLEAGASEVVPETLEATLAIANHLLLLLEVSEPRVLSRIDTARADRYRRLHPVFSGESDGARRKLSEGQLQLRAVTVPGGARSVGRTLAELGMDGAEISVTAVRRNGLRIPDLAWEPVADIQAIRPAPDFRLRAGDIVVLYGKRAALDEFELLLSRCS